MAKVGPQDEAANEKGRWVREGRVDVNGAASRESPGEEVCVHFGIKHRVEGAAVDQKEVLEIAY